MANDEETREYWPSNRDLINRVMLGQGFQNEGDVLDEEMPMAIRSDASDEMVRAVAEDLAKHGIPHAIRALLLRNPGFRVIFTEEYLGKHGL